MRIAIIGTQNSGKSFLINKFLKRWSMYEKANPTYRDLIDKSTPLNQSGTVDSQRIIRDALALQAITNKDKKYKVHDRCILDNLIYSLWLFEKGKIKDEDFIAESFNMTRECLTHYDLIFFLPLDNKIKVEKRENRDIDLNYRKEINNLFESAIESYRSHEGIIFPRENCPAVIEIRGDEEKDEKTNEIAKYIDENGNAIETGTLMTELDEEYKRLQKLYLEKMKEKQKGKK